MKVAIDLRPLQLGHQHRGIGAYIINLLQRLPPKKSIDYVFLRYDVSDPLKDFNINIGSDYKEVVTKKRVFSKHPFKLFAYGFTGLLPSYSELKHHKPDVFFQPYYLLGAPRIRGCRVVTVAYDFIPLIFRQIYLPSWTKHVGFGQLKIKSRVRLMLRSWYYAKKYSRGLKLLRRADQIVSISKSTKSDLIEFTGISPEKVKTIYPAASFRQDATEQEIRPKIQQIIDSIEVPYICYVGATDRRRQVDELVLGFNLYNARISSLGLVLCGNEFEPNSKEINDAAKQAIENSSYKDAIFALGKVTEAEKKYILTKSAGFVYPTLYEGFGLPLVEAMACGTPIVSYKNSCIPEIAQDFPIYTESMGGYPIYQSLKILLAGGGPSSKQIEMAKKRADSFNWETCAKETWDTVLGS